MALPASAHSVGLRNTRVFMDPDTSEMLTERALSGGGGVQVGDILEYVIEFEPYENGAEYGPNGWVTFYPPDFAQVVGASFVVMEGNDFVPIPVPESGAIWDGVGPLGGESPYGAPFELSLDGSLAQLYGDTGIFFSTSEDTAKYVGGGDPATTPLGNNGYFVDPTACGQLEPAEWDNCWAHNSWDKEMTDRMGTAGGSIIDSGRGTTPYLAGSPVAGPDSYYSLDYTGAIGPWQRIRYPGSMVGTGLVPDPADGDGPIAPTASTAWVPVTPGVNDGRVLDDSNPLPSTTTAVRFAVGSLHAVPGLSDLGWVKVALRVTEAPTTCTIIDAEVFGGDAGSDDDGKDNPWRYYVPISAVNSSCLTVHKSGPQQVATGDLISYTVSIANTSPDPLTNVVVTDLIDAQTSFTAASSGGVYDGGSNTVTWPSIPMLAPGAGVSYTVEVSAPATTETVSNQAATTSDETSWVFSVWDTTVVDASVSGHTFRDDDGSGVQDVGEPDLAGVDVIVTDGNGAQTVTTDAAGAWALAVAAGAVSSDVVDATVPAGHILSTGNDPQAVVAVAGILTPSESVGFDPGPPSVDVSKSPSVDSVPEPGGTVTYTVEVTNTSVEPITLNSLSDDIFGDLLDGSNPAISDNTCDDQPTAVDVDGTFTCTFDAALVGDYGDPDHVNVVTASVDDGDGNTAEGSDDATVTFHRPSVRRSRRQRHPGCRRPRPPRHRPGDRRRRRHRVPGHFRYLRGLGPDGDPGRRHPGRRFHHGAR